MGNRHAGSDRGIAAQTLLVGGPVQIDHEFVQPRLITDILTGQDFGDFHVDGLDGLGHVPSPEGFAAVAQVYGFETSTRSACRGNGDAFGTTLQFDFNLDGRTTAGIPDAACMTFLDRELAHNVSLWSLPRQLFASVACHAFAMSIG